MYFVRSKPFIFSRIYKLKVSKRKYFDTKMKKKFDFCYIIQYLQIFHRLDKVEIQNKKERKNMNNAYIMKFFPKQSEQHCF